MLQEALPKLVVFFHLFLDTYENIEKLIPFFYVIKNRQN